MPNNLISQKNKEGLSFFYSEQHSIYGEFSSLYLENGESQRNGTDFDGYPAIKHTKHQTIFQNYNP